MLLSQEIKNEFLCTETEKRSHVPRPSKAPEPPQPKPEIES
jgi:hypothetical protein